MSEQSKNESVFPDETLPVMALRGITVFPEMIINFDVERTASIAALNAAAEADRRIFLVAQRDILKEYPERDDLYGVGTICTIRQFLRMPNNCMRVMVEGCCRAQMISYNGGAEPASAVVRALDIPPVSAGKTRTEALLRQVLSVYNAYVSASGASVPETLVGLTLSTDPSYVADYIAQNSGLKYTEKQEILETLDALKRLKKLSRILSREVQVLTIEHEINDKLHEQLSEIQKENVLREQLRVIRGELGEDDVQSEAEEYHDRIAALKLPEETQAHLFKEAERLGRQSYGSAEASVIRSYLDLCLGLPWHTATKERLNIKTARKILDEDHFGLEKVKERVIEQLAVRKLAPDMKGAILCLVGPPGVGKTSVAISIARATNRRLARVSLGGVHDEAEIRGHRKTYVGAMPGRIITAVNQAGANNPLLLLDEIDKLGNDFRGDPASALLEALDPEQNSTFRDHFLEVPFDLSNVFFITTANTVDTIPRPLLDRMEVIELSSYTDEEKLHIAQNYLIRKQRRKHGLSAGQFKIGPEAIRGVIDGYTRESGVRQLEREIGALCRKAAVQIAGGEAKSVSVRLDDLERLLGPRRFKPDRLAHKDEIGIVKGLAWTSAGGEILEVEVNVLEGSGKLELTGNLGDVMKESAHAAVSYIRSRADKLGIDRDFYKTKDIHIHFPEGAVPKDGPSAGITITVAVVSALTRCPVRRDIAMTGEITLNGRILPIGGLKEKTMAALRNGVRTVILPADNAADLEEIDQDVRRALNFITTDHVDKILDVAIDFNTRREKEQEAAAMPAVRRSEGAGPSIRQ